jgi:hypothetical protein
MNIAALGSYRTHASEPLVWLLLSTSSRSDALLTGAHAMNGHGDASEVDVVALVTLDDRSPARAPGQ